MELKPGDRIKCNHGPIHEVFEVLPGGYVRAVNIEDGLDLWIRPERLEHWRVVGNQTRLPL